jgi:hypothetical protein
MSKDPPRKPESLPVKKPASKPAPPPPERLPTTSLEAVGATLEEDKEPEKKPAPKGSNIATVIGVPALADPAAAPAAEKKEEKKDEKKGDPKKAPAISTLVMPKPGPQAPMALKPPTDSELAKTELGDAPSPTTRIPTPDPEPAIPTASLVDSLKAKYKEILEGPRPRLYMFAGIAGALVLIFIGLLVRLIRGSPNESAETTSATASASASVSSSEQTAPPVTTQGPVAAPPPKIPVCTASHESKVIGPRGVVAAGLELAVVDGSIVLGWASTPKDAAIATIDPASATATNNAGLSAPGTLKRVLPRLPPDKSILDVDGKAPRAIGSYEVSQTNGEIVLGGKPLWKVDSGGTAESLRGATTSDGIVIAYRHAGAIFVGATKGGEPSAPPVRVAGLGQVGSPAIAASGNHVIVAWADRAEGSQPWGLRYFTWTLGSPPDAAASFPLPENAISPGLASLGGGFLLVWTEGPADHQKVRVRVLGFDGKPSGEAMTVSPDGVHSGQGQAAVLPDGRGIIAFLSDTGKTFEVRTTTVRCD